MYLAACLSIISLLSLGVLADDPPFYSNAKYNSGGYGKYVTQTFKSNPQVTSVPVVNFMKPFTNCNDGSLLFMSPRGNEPDSTPLLLDMTGSLVWASEQKYGEVYNVKAQQYKDEVFLTFWAGNDAVGGHGIGEYYMLDQQYKERYRIKAANDLGGDLHEFTITPHDTALITVYQPIAIDISSAGFRRGRGFIWDSMFQELDLETGEAIFQWRASDHIPIENSYTNPNSATKNDPWDVYHINSVEKDYLGNYLISVRFLRAMLYIDGKTGDVLWQLGGKDNSFSDLSGGKATAFMGQHDAHWQDGHKYITFFDNRADWYHKMSDQSQGTKIEVDLEQMTAKLDQTFVDPFINVLSTSQGSYQTLPNGNVLLGYGYNGVVAEFSPEGELLCDAYIQPSSTFGTGDVQSYRNFKFHWTAYPDTKPSLVLDSKTLYMSWNGATEIATWLMLGSDTYDEEYEQSMENHEDNIRSVEDAFMIDKSGFETELQVFKGEGLRRFFRVVALDKDGRPLGTSNVVDIGDLATVSGASHYDASFTEGTYDESHEGDYTYTEDDMEDVRLLIIFGLCAVLSALLIVVLALGRKRIVEKFSSAKSGNLDEKPAMAEERKTSTRLSALMQRIRGMIPALRRRNSFTDVSAKEGLLRDEEEDGAEMDHHYLQLPLDLRLDSMTQGISGPER